MSISGETNNLRYRYNTPFDENLGCIDDSMWLMVKNAEDQKDKYDWRGNEIIICSYPRSGTHMTWNLVRYMLQENTDRLPDAMTESGYPPYFRLEGSPQTGDRRLLYSHHIPCQYTNEDLLKTGNRKFIYVVRNPNDVAVSTFNIWQDMTGMIIPKQFSDYYKEFISGTTIVHICAWVKHVKAWEEYSGKNPDVSIMFQFYEDLHRKPRQSIRKIAKFLNIELCDTFLDELVEASKFDKMRKNKIDQNFSETMSTDGSVSESVYRKGKIGDWENCLTVQNYELFQKVFVEDSADMACKDKLVFV